MCMRSMDVWAIKYGWEEWKKFWTHFGIYSLLIGAKKTHRFHGIIIYLGNIFRAHKFSFFSFVCEWVKCVLLGSREIIWQNQCLLFGGLSMMWWKYVKSRKSTLDLWHILLLLFGSMSASVCLFLLLNLMNMNREWEILMEFHVHWNYVLSCKYDKSNDEKR